MLKEIDNERGLDFLQKYFKSELNNNNPFTIYSHSIAYIECNYIKGILVYDYIYDRIEINYIVVDDINRKQGIASMLLNFLINKSKCSISLEVNSKNSAAINLYNKFNFEVVAIRKNYYGSEDALLMIRK